MKRLYKAGFSNSFFDSKERKNEQAKYMQKEKDLGEILYELVQILGQVELDEEAR